MVNRSIIRIDPEDPKNEDKWKKLHLLGGYVTRSNLGEVIGNSRRLKIECTLPRHSFGEYYSGCSMNVEKDISLDAKDFTGRRVTFYTEGISLNSMCNDAKAIELFDLDGQLKFIYVKPGYAILEEA